MELYINDEFFSEKVPDFLAAPSEVRVVYEDGNILLADKPQGLIVHEDQGETVDTPHQPGEALSLQKRRV